MSRRTVQAYPLSLSPSFSSSQQVFGDEASNHNYYSMEIAQQQIRRLSEAIEKKAACEDKILRMIAMMASEKDKLHSIMKCVLSARQQLVLQAASSDKYKEMKR
jgi:hypothetical protein